MALPKADIMVNLDRKLRSAETYSVFGPVVVAGPPGAFCAAAITSIAAARGMSVATGPALVKSIRRACAGSKRGQCGREPPLGLPVAAKPAQ